MSIKSKELKPTKENIIKTIIKDSIDRNESLIKFISLIDAIDESCSIAIDGAWGDGKTFFVLQSKLLIDCLNPNTSLDISEEDKNMMLSFIKSSGLSPDDFEPQFCVYYDAWSNDNDIDPLLSLIYEIGRISAVGFESINSKSLAEKIVAIADFLSGRSFNDLYDVFKSEDPLLDIKQQKAIDVLVAEYIDSLLVERGNRLIVIIDELDRCTPSFAVKLLEQVKHFFDNDRVTFVFSINSNELQHTIKKHYGENFNSARYLDRFFDLRISLPPANMEKYYLSIGAGNQMNSFDYVRGLVAVRYSMSLREAEKYYKITSIALEKAIESCRGWTFDDNLGKAFAYNVIAPLMIGMKMIDSKSYDAFVNGNDSSPLIELLKGDKRAERICLNLITESESYIEIDGKSKVALDERLEQAYHALFGSAKRDEDVAIGRCVFERDIKTDILKKISMVSNFATY